jgi:CspA family cold shock protein
MDIGIVKFFNAGKGFGFVTPDAGGADIFLPASSVTTAGLARLEAGQRVSFEQVPDTKGPKVVSLKLIGEAPAKPVAAVPPKERVTIYCDGTSDAAADVLDALQAGGYQLTLHDYIVTPPGIEELRRISHQLGEGGQSLVRRYDSLFLALQLDDRFISEQDFWTAIVEHPTLINGPVLVRSGKACICKSADDVRAYLNKGGAVVPPKTKTLSPRIAAMLKGEAAPAPLSPVPTGPAKKPAGPAPVKPVAAVTKTGTETRQTPKAAARSGPKPKAATIKKAAAPKKAAKPANKAVASKKAVKPAKTKSRR